MPITPEIVRHIAKLACLELSEDEIAQYSVQLSDILDYAARLQSIDTTDIPPTSSVLPAQTVLREDIPAQEQDSDDLLKNAPALVRGQYQVPPVFESQ